MIIEVFTVGCGKCKMLEFATHAALDELGLDIEVVRLTNFTEMKERGVMSTPALFIDHELKVQGRIPLVAEIKGWIKEAIEHPAASGEVH